jgi:long-chain acyl-CoA synthetase
MRRTLNHLFQQAVQERARPDMFMRRRDRGYEPISSQDFDAAVRELSEALVARGIRPGDRVVLLSENRVEWAMADLAILGARAVVVPLYPSLRSRQILEQVRDCTPRLIFCSDARQLQKLRRIQAELPNDLLVASFEAHDEPDLLSLATLRAEGRAAIDRSGDGYDERIDRVDPNDVATILYTSGTTGEPKGVMLTHENIVFNVVSGVEAMGISHTDRCLSFLPLCHILERTGGYYAMIHGGVSIAYADSVETIAKNMPQVRPTIMICVPRVFEKIDSTLMAKAASNSLHRRVVLWARQVAVLYARKTIAGERLGFRLRLSHALADGLVFRKLRARTGGRIRLFLSGGAPLSKELAEFFYGAGLPVMEGYGLTETSPMIALNTFRHLRPGSVGKPPPGIAVRIAEDGEILTSSPSVMKGYLDRPDATAEAIQGGWFHTGDIGTLDADGFLYVTDRKKDLIVTSGGKNIAPQAVENELKKDLLIAQVALIGDQRQFVVALVAPDQANLVPWARHKKLAFSDPAELLSSQELYDHIQEKIDAVNSHLARYEQIKRFAILPKELGVETGELTPTMKVKRREIARNYADLIEGLYDGS